MHSTMLIPFAAIYASASVVCFTAYAMDKAAARAGRWRISERTLLLLGLVGGWPGAVLAQQCLRHKSRKPSFRTWFWFTVLCNVAATAFLAGAGVPDALGAWLQGVEKWW